MFKNILVPFDGSDHAEKAVALAGDLARQYEAKVTLLYCYNEKEARALKSLARSEHLVPEAASRSDRPTSLDEPPGPTVYSRVGKMVLSHADAALREKGIRQFDSIVATGDPAKQILHHARDRAMDMIIMGSRGRSDLEALIGGSVSHKVSHEADCTCVTVK